MEHQSFLRVGSHLSSQRVSACNAQGVNQICRVQVPMFVDGFFFSGFLWMFFFLGGGKEMVV